MDPRIAIIGAGRLSTRRIYPNIGAAGAELVGVCDVDVERAAVNARRFGGRPYSDWETMLEAEAPDGVIVCIGPYAHAEFAKKLIPRGLPVYTEKPPAETAAQALEVARLAKEHSVLCTTAFKKRYTRAADRAQSFLAEFPPDERLCLSVDYASAAYTNETPRQSFLLDFCVHAIDLAAYLFGDVAAVYAMTRDEHAWAISLRYACGAVGSLSFNDGRSFGVPTEEIELSLRGGNFMTIHNSSTWRICRDGQPGEWREPPTFTSAGDSGFETGHLAELQGFVNDVAAGNTSSRSCIAESYKSMLLYEAILTSAREQRLVELAYTNL